MRVTRLLPSPRLKPASAAAAVDVDKTVDLEDDGPREVLAGWYEPPQRNWLRVNLVASVDGGAAGGDGTSDTLTNPVDRTILRVIRQAADAVLVGARSVRIEGYRMPVRGTLAVVTVTGDLAGHGLADVAGRGGRLLVLAPAEAQSAVRRSLGDVPHDFDALGEAGPVPPAELLAALRRRGLASIVCEGGPHLAGRLVDAGVVDELCLTTSPAVGGSPLRMLDGVTRHHDLALTQLLVDDRDALYARWRFRER